VARRVMRCLHCTRCGTARPFHFPATRPDCVVPSASPGVPYCAGPLPTTRRRLDFCRASSLPLSHPLHSPYPMVSRCHRRSPKLALSVCSSTGATMIPSHGSRRVIRRMTMTAPRSPRSPSRHSITVLLHAIAASVRGLPYLSVAIHVRGLASRSWA
jgi:hypothetical protein